MKSQPCENIKKIPAESRLIYRFPQGYSIYCC